MKNRDKTCTAGVDGKCPLEVFAKDLCKAHYSAHLQGRSLDYEIVKRAKYNAQEICEVEGCSKEFYSKGKCANHYMREQRKKMKEENKWTFTQ